MWTYKMSMVVLAPDDRDNVVLITFWILELL